MPKIKKYDIQYEEKTKYLFSNTIIITFAFFIFSSILLGFLSIIFKLNGEMSQVKDFILTISGVFSGPLGITIGYHFRSPTDKKDNPR